LVSVGVRYYQLKGARWPMPEGPRKGPELVAGLATSVPTLDDDLSAIQSLQLIRAFMSIEDAAMRRSLIELTERIADQRRRPN